MRLKFAKISISNINQVLPSLKTYQAHLYFNKLSGITYIAKVTERACKRYSIDLDILHECFSSSFTEL